MVNLFSFRYRPVLVSRGFGQFTEEPVIRLRAEGREISVLGRFQSKRKFLRSILSPVVEGSFLHKCHAFALSP
jgi:hypothetical protein